MNYMVTSYRHFGENVELSFQYNLMKTGISGKRQNTLLVETGISVNDDN